MFKPNYTITAKILNTISKLSEIKTLVEKSRVLPLNEAQLRRQAIVRMAHTSTSIEGNPLAEYQVDRVLSGMSVNADAKSILEVKNYQKAIEQMERLIDQKKPLTLTNILELHQIVMKDLLESKKVGHFRPGSVYVVDDLGDGREHLRFEGPLASKVPYLLNELLRWLEQAEKDNLHPVIKAAVFHLQFVSIHPFSDGNGRMARLLTTLLLYKDGWDFRKIIVLEDYYNRDRIAYYNAENIVQGQKYHEGGDLTPWLEYFIEGFLVEAKKVEQAIEAVGFGRLTKDQIPVYLDRDEVKIMDFLTTTGRLTSSDVEDVIGVAKRTAQLKLKNLVDKGLIKSQGKGPATYYVLSQP